MLGDSSFNFPNDILYVFLSLKINFVLANIADPGEMPYYAAHSFSDNQFCLRK